MSPRDDVDRAVLERGRHNASSPKRKPMRAVDAAARVRRSIMVRNDSRIDTPLIGRVGSWRGTARRPAAERLDDRLGLQPPVGRFIDLDVGRRRQALAPDQPARLELAQPLGQHVGADPGQVGAKLGETARPEHQFAQHQQRPALADQLEPMGGSAGIVIPRFGSTRRFELVFLTAWLLFITSIGKRQANRVRRSETWPDDSANLSSPTFGWVPDSPAAWSATSARAGRSRKSASHYRRRADPGLAASRRTIAMRPPAVRPGPVYRDEQGRDFRIGRDRAAHRRAGGKLAAARPGGADRAPSSG